MAKLIDLTGKTFDRWTVIERAPVEKDRIHWLCRCSCGKQKIVSGWNLKAGTSRSCGCLRAEEATVRIQAGACTRETHGMSRTPVYRSWASMKARCHNPASGYYHIYGGRGIKVCERWEVFENFYADMGEPGNDANGHRMTLDRIDVNGDYEPGNCKWSSPRQQSRNRRNTAYVEYQGQMRCLQDLADEHSANASAMWSRVNQLGWTVEEALTIPVRPLISTIRKQNAT